MTGEYVDHFSELAEEGIGYLTWDEWDRLLRAWTTAAKHLSWWWVAGHIRGGDIEELRVRSSELPIGLPATFLAADEIASLMRELNGWPDLEDAVRDNLGHYLASQFTSCVETAAAKWPISDRNHRVKYFRCQACDQQSLKYYPPNVGNRLDAPMVDVQIRLAHRMVGAQLMDVVVRCSNKECNSVMDHAMFERAAVMVAYEQELRSGKRRMGADTAGAGDDQQESSDGVSVGSEGTGAEDETGTRDVRESA